MSIASEYSGFDWDNLLLPHEFWSDYFEEVFEDSSEAAESMVRVLFEILDAIQKGSDARAKIVNTLKDGIEYAYRYTGAHKAGLNLYLLYMEGVLKPDDEPIRLLPRAVGRGRNAARAKEERERE